MTASSPSPRFLFVGPRPDAPGGIAQFQSNLVRHVAEHAETHVLAFRRLYPRWSRAGRQPADGSAEPVPAPVSPVVVPWSPRTWRTAGRLVERYRPAVVVAQWWHPVLAPALRSMIRTARTVGARVVFVCHNSSPHERFPFQDSLSRRTLAEADVLLALSEPVAGALHELVPGVSIEVLAHPANVRAAGGDGARAWRERIGPVEGPVILFFGNVRQYKGLEDLVAALPIVRRTVPATLVVAGRFFQSEERIRRLARDLGVRDAVKIFPSYVPVPDVSGLFEVADVVALPYRSASQSGIVAQAALFQKPVVATEVGGLPEAIGGRGIVVPPGDPASLAAGLVRALLDPPPAPLAPSAEWEDWRDALLSQAGLLEAVRR